MANVSYLCRAGFRVAWQGHPSRFGRPPRETRCVPQARALHCFGGGVTLSNNRIGGRIPQIRYSAGPVRKRGTFWGLGSRKEGGKLLSCVLGACRDSFRGSNRGGRLLFAYPERVRGSVFYSLLCQKEDDCAWSEAVDAKRPSIAILFFRTRCQAQGATTDWCCSGHSFLRASVCHGIERLRLSNFSWSSPSSAF